MAKLTTAARNKLKESTFALPGRRFPLNDANHARNALARASQGVKAGTLSPAQAATVRRKANAKLGKTDNTGVEQNLNRGRLGNMALAAALSRRRAGVPSRVGVPAAGIGIPPGVAPGTGVVQDLNAANLGRRAVARANGSDNRNPNTPYQEDINNWKSNPYTNREKWKMNSDGKGSADQGPGGINYKSQPKFGGTQAPSASKKGIAKTGGTESPGQSYKGQPKFGGTGVTQKAPAKSVESNSAGNGGSMRDMIRGH